MMTRKPLIDLTLVEGGIAQAHALHWRLDLNLPMRARAGSKLGRREVARQHAPQPYRRRVRSSRM